MEGSHWPRRCTSELYFARTLIERALFNTVLLSLEALHLQLKDTCCPCLGYIIWRRCLRSSPRLWHVFSITRYRHLSVLRVREEMELRPGETSMSLLHSLALDASYFKPCCTRTTYYDGSYAHGVEHGEGITLCARGPERSANTPYNQQWVLHSTAAMA